MFSERPWWTASTTSPVTTPSRRLDCPKPSLSTSVTSPGRGKSRDIGHLVVRTVVHIRWP